MANENAGRRRSRIVVDREVKYGFGYGPVFLVDWVFEESSNYGLYNYQQIYLLY